MSTRPRLVWREVGRLSPVTGAASRAPSTSCKWEQTNRAPPLIFVDRLVRVNLFATLLFGGDLVSIRVARVEGPIFGSLPPEVAFFKSTRSTLRTLLL